MGLYEKDNYLADIDFLISTKIREYDMKDAGFNLTRHYKLLPQKTIDYLLTLNKKQRKIQIGIYMRDDDEYNKALTNAFKDARGMFFEANRIEDNQVLSIKKDAIFLIGKSIQHQTFGDYIFFDIKNTYTSFYNINGLEFYYSPKIIDVKGISDKIIEEYHMDHMMRFFITCMRLIETGQTDQLRRYLKKFVGDYKAFKLDPGYYRQFDEKSRFSLDMPKSKCVYYLNMLNSDSIPYTNVGFNYIKYILFFVQNFM